MPYTLYLILYTLIAALEFSEASAIPTRLAHPSGSGLKTCDTDGGSALKVLPTGSGPFDLFSAEASLFDDDPSETREVASLTGEGHGRHATCCVGWFFVIALTPSFADF
jgi:hypothetical protein